MFEQAVLSNGPASKRVWTTFAGITGQAMLVTFAVMIPMIWPEAMPSHQSLLRVFSPGPPPGPPPKPEAAAETRVTRAVPKQWREGSLPMPVRVPPHVAMIEDPPELSAGPGSRVGVAGGSEAGVPDGIVGSILSVAPRVAPPRVVEAARPTPTAAPERTIPRLQVGGNVHLGELIRRVEPRYPALARTARISGTVELEAVVGIDGRIRELKLKSGNPLLAPAAIEAVRQWIYTPTTLNGDPVEIIAPITITFRLN